MNEKTEYTGGEIESYETQRLLDHDTLAQNYEEDTQEVQGPRFTTRATLQICMYIYISKVYLFKLLICFIPI